MTFDGLDELKAILRNLPADLTGEARHIIEGTVNYAEQQIKAGYRGRAELVDHVSSTLQVSTFGVIGTIKNTSKLAYIFEEGTQARHYLTVRGKTHLTGKMPAGHVFVPIAMRERKRMYDDLKDMLTRNGLEVSGDVDAG